ncbi:MULTISPECIES: hypothetical protein [Pedobacter]|uniref:MetA-pathway of phenol degradation n=1 Tax=Pedobacter zeae TaxID=1737356 RepID=A0A7W6KCV4_9SPHI|nr:hypothetical protein [Pedobacter zeae]MBB4109473.1 hypothetical protein [Pedobacter zeae]GGH12420.1 hypothetical protein GCM10007422_32340 [Pedobacter zeae]
MKQIFVLALMLIGVYSIAAAQELYVFTEPASNMPTKSIGVRITNEGMFNYPGYVSRTIPEVMIGFNKNLMMHTQAFLSDMDGKYRLEGGSLYAKYRFLSLDETHSHFRASAFGRISTSRRPTYTRDINLEGDNSGVQGGLIFTQLLHKLALSSTLGYAHAFENHDRQIAGMPQPKNMLSYSLSSGYLVLPVVYKDYKQPNFNVYLELLGKTDPKSGQSYLDIAPAVQMILNSKTRIDLGYRFQAAGNMDNRYTKNMYLLRAEFNFFNVLK